MSDRRFAAIAIAFATLLAWAIILFESGCATVPGIDPKVARCDALAGQYRAYGAAALFSTALGGAAIAPAALPTDEGTRAGFAITAATLAALGVALELVAGDLETEWVSGCETPVETSTISE